MKRNFGFSIFVTLRSIPAHTKCIGSLNTVKPHLLAPFSKVFRFHHFCPILTRGTGERMPSGTFLPN